MQVTLEAIDWSELKKFKDAEEFGNWRVDLDEDPEWILSAEETGWGNDSYSTYSSIADALTQISDDLPSAQQDLLSKSYRILFISDEKQAIQDFPCESDFCYFMALSPDRVAAVLDSIGKIDRESIIDGITDVLDDVERDDVAGFFDQVDSVVRAAVREKWGIIGFAG